MKANTKKPHTSDLKIDKLFGTFGTSTVQSQQMQIKLLS